MSVGRRLAQIGVLGWIFVVPTLAGLFLGRWLDARFATGIFWTAPVHAAGALPWRLDRLEMDERAMIDLSCPPAVLILPLCFAGGLLLGLAYFRALRGTADLIVSGGRPLLALALTLGRLVVLGAGLFPRGAGRRPCPSGGTGGRAVRQGPDAAPDAGGTAHEFAARFHRPVPAWPGSDHAGHRHDMGDHGGAGAGRIAADPPA